MTAILNGLSLHGGFIPYGGTFLVFSDYARNALRMAALMRTRNILVFTHDSIGLGEAFTAKYMWGIVNSKVFVPVFSEGYYAKNHCRNEMDLAYKRSVEKLLKILPVVDGAEVPPIYTHINYVEVAVNPDFIQAIEKVLKGSGDSEQAG